MGGPLGKKNSLAQKPKPLQGRKKEELQVELEGRGIMKDANRMLKLDLEKELATELRGLRVSALAIVCSNPSVSFESLNLQSYEALGCEPMHGISNHIANVLTEELPNLLRGETKSRFHETRELSLRNKEAKIARDHRVANHPVRQETDWSGHWDTADGTSAAYAKVYDTSPRLILRIYHNISFLYFCDAQSWVRCTSNIRKCQEISLQASSQPCFPSTNPTASYVWWLVKHRRWRKHFQCN